MTIQGNLELSKEVLHKSLNFMCSDVESNRIANVGGDEDANQTIYSGKNYSDNFLRQLMKRGVTLKEGLIAMEDRFMSQGEKHFLIMIVDSILKG